MENKCTIDDNSVGSMDSNTHYPRGVDVYIGSTEKVKCFSIIVGYEQTITGYNYLSHDYHRDYRITGEFDPIPGPGSTVMGRYFKTEFTEHTND